MSPSTPGTAAVAASQTRPTPDGEGASRFQQSALAQEVAFLTARSRSRGNALANQMLVDLDLKVRHYAVLAMACSGTNPSQRELGSFLDLDPSQVVALVDALEHRELIRRAPDPRDRRSKILIATDSGHDLYTRASERTRAAERQLLTALTPQEQDELRRLLAKIVF
ncbi:MarR family winged helix-turn-helix transcriptional regulator [Nesterenkonia haasae]|uniref:MarR family winged helix-turn-helix transcriptional regulator n=1 Tax=Nesterenkonia haasae TaxID=2587813 RepID=UPI001390D5F8|nr:MarR family winged helix-turn-helix transcriptional regulator [Nesterenkonia haasae]NDK31913.1 winged helix-turn-helix transcriptional regulator [Nesterenkonia haasae]